jgi:hypothetical protein
MDFDCEIVECEYELISPNGLCFVLDFNVLYMSFNVLCHLRVL